MRIELAGDLPRLKAVAQSFARVWLTPKGQPPLGTDVLRAIVHAGGAVHIAHNGSGVAGACAAIFRPPAARGVYSLIAAARSSDRGVGFALKQAQRAWALEHGPLDDGQDETDRLTAVWSLTGPRAAAAAAGRYAEVTGPDLGRAEIDPRRAPPDPRGTP